MGNVNREMFLKEGNLDEIAKRYPETCLCHHGNRHVSLSRMHFSL